jgi:MoxR-like ATPase
MKPVMPPTDFRLYKGNGQPLPDRDHGQVLYEDLPRLNDPAGYLAERGLSDAVNVALLLGQPLLVTGEPGTGKTQSAWSIAYELNFPPPLAFYTKTTSTAQDLFYRYDAISHFRDAQLGIGQRSAEDYITYEALGLAILRALGYEQMEPMPYSAPGGEPTRSVVLIDEIDKAPRDFPNDILNEIETLSFVVKETGRRFSAEGKHRPIIVFTSNSEKNLPDAFLRRCIFYHITFPDEGRLNEIVRRRLGLRTGFTEQMREGAIRHFLRIRELLLRKKPATAELLGWLRLLEARGIDVTKADAETLFSTYSVLVKTDEDLETLRNFVLTMKAV